jgi:hypothetical protein
MCRERDGASDFFVSSDGGRIPITEQAYTEMALTQKPQTLPRGRRSGCLVFDVDLAKLSSKACVNVHMSRHHHDLNFPATD